MQLSCTGVPVNFAPQSKRNFMDIFLRLYLPSFLIGFIVAVFVVPSVLLYRQTGINPFRFATKHNNAHDFIGNSMKWFIVLLLAMVFVYALFPRMYTFLAPFPYLELDGLKITGLAMGHLSLAGIVAAQRQMKQSWRIGIDFEHRTALVTSGLFAWSRNPIYLFLLIALTGLFLVVPNAVTFAVLFAAYLVLHIAMRMEEDFLTTQHGQAYLNYKTKVRRLI